MRTLFLLSLVLITLSVAAQQTPELFQPGIVTNGGVFGFTLSPDGKEAFWVNSNGGRDTLVIMTSVKARGAWQKPSAATFSGKPGVWKDIDPVFSPDGETLLFQSDRPVDGQPNRKGFDIWAVKRINKTWSEPIYLGNVINSDESESFASVTQRGNVYFMKQNPDGVGSSDIYLSRFANGKYERPDNLGSPINTSFRESNPFISPKEDFLIYFSSDTTGFGEVDLMISFKNKNGWTKPKNLGNTINTQLGEFCPFYHEKEKRLYFCRTLQGQNGRRVEDIYVVDFDPDKYRTER